MKSLIWLPALFSIGVAIYKPVKEVTVCKIENKSVSLIIYKSAEYNAPIYDNSTASVYIIVEKVNNKGQRTVVWNKTLRAELLSQYPSLNKAIAQNIIVPNVNNKREHVEVSYILTYDSKGTQLQMQDEEVLTGTNGNVQIKI